MELSIILTTVLTTFATAPDLCADVLLDAAGEPVEDALGQTFARYCQLAGPDAPVFQADTCCTIDHDGAHCSMPDPRGRCAIGMKMSCDYAEVVGDGVVCLQPLPSACELGDCHGGEVPLELGTDPQANSICCINGICYPIASGADVIACVDNDGYLAWCEHGYSKTNGTVECYD